MSHIVRVSGVIVANLDALKSVLPALGLEFVEGKQTYKTYYGETEGVAHAIRRADLVGYEVGLKPLASGGFELTYDEWGTHGRKLLENAGERLTKLLQAYSAEAATRQLYAEGYQVTFNTLEDGTRELVAVKY